MLRVILRAAGKFRMFAGRDAVPSAIKLQLVCIQYLAPRDGVLRATAWAGRQYS